MDSSRCLNSPEKLKRNKIQQYNDKTNRSIKICGDKMPNNNASLKILQDRSKMKSIVIEIIDYYKNT